MRYDFVVEREKESTLFGLRFTGLADASKPIVILEVRPGSLVDMVNRWNSTAKYPRPSIQPGDIILSANGCSKASHGSEMMRLVLRGDRRVLFAMERGDYDPWDIMRLAGPSVPPPASLLPAGRPRPPAARPRSLVVDPLTVRFTHDRINPCFRDGGSLDTTIDQILNGNMSIKAFPSMEVSRDIIGIGWRGEMGRGEGGEGDCNRLHCN